jgi:hypothetical protein
MKLGLNQSSLPSSIRSSICAVTLPALALAIGAAVVGCSSTSSKGGLFSSNPSSANDGGTNPGDDSANDPPHALGIIALGESHESGGSTPTPYVSASFIPDSTTSATCTSTISGCTVPVVATCQGQVAPQCGGGAEALCTLDASCNAGWTCQAACTEQCGTGEECYVESSGAEACRPIESFNAGALAFAGTTTPLTLYPPYSFTPIGSGSLFLAGAALEVQGSGSTGAGFAAFDEKFTATTFMQTSPSLSTLSASDVWGGGSIPVGWAPGADSIIVSVTGPLGMAQCPATDSSGHFDVPREVVNAVLGSGTQSITLSVTREHNDVHKDAKTQGTLTTATVQPIGFLELSTSSTESFSFQGCGASETGSTETMCSDGCVDLQVSTTDCGTCGHVCAGGDYCSNGTCYGTSQQCGSLTTCSDGCQNLETSNTDCGSCGHPCTNGQTCSDYECSGNTGTTCSSCEVTVEGSGGACATQYTTCANDANCGDYSSCMGACATGDSTCEENCEVEYESGMTEAENLQTCICSQQCTSQCSTDSFCTKAL